MPKQAGFSLIELIIVLVITIGIIGLAAPRLNGALERAEFKRQVRAVFTSLQETHNQAISKGKATDWYIDLDNHYYQFGLDNKKVSYSPDFDVTITSASKLQRTESIVGFQFFPDGSATGGEIVLENDTSSYAIQINWLTGQIELYD